MRYVSTTRRAEWSTPDNMHLAPDWHDQISGFLPASLAAWLPLYSPLILAKRLDESVPKVMARLLVLHPHWLAGTDSAQYNFQIPGYALLDELRLMERHGIARAEVLRAATSEPAAAMRRAGEFGEIRPGMRADLVLLSGDPVKDLAVFHANRGVMVNGGWLDRVNLDAALEDLAKIQAESDARFTFSQSEANALGAEVLQLSGRDIALDPKLLAPAVIALQHQGYSSAAVNLTAANRDTAPGPCRELLPGDSD